MLCSIARQLVWSFDPDCYLGVYPRWLSAVLASLTPPALVWVGLETVTQTEEARGESLTEIDDHCALTRRVASLLLQPDHCAKCPVGCCGSAARRWEQRCRCACRQPRWRPA